ncbi:MAG: NTP transferase domain-containing protein, partial [Muribaculaceae bacterium]|nr:NTP transferase domain-containing protein [Muribaculaceae bacterium]
MKRHLIHSDASMLEALNRLNELSGSTMTLFVVDGRGRVAGTLTDGDVRRALLAGLSLDSPAVAAARRDFRRLEAGRPDVRAMRECRMAGIRLLPVLRADGTLERIIDLNHTPTELPLRALLMAGGKGERLRPLTLTVPKPLLQIEGKAIIDYNIEALAACGVRDITVSVRYLAEALEAHFAEPVAGVSVRIVREDAPLGTIGAASMVELPAGGSTLVMNSDLLTTVSFEEMYLCHDSELADITIAAIPYT